MFWGCGNFVFLNKSDKLVRIYYTHTHVGDIHTDTHILPHILACEKSSIAQCIPWCRCSLWKPIYPETLTEPPSPSLPLFTEIWLFHEATTSPAAFSNECVHSPAFHMPYSMSGRGLHILLVPQLSFTFCQHKRPMLIALLEWDTFSAYVPAYIGAGRETSLPP